MGVGVLGFDIAQHVGIVCVLGCVLNVVEKVLVGVMKRSGWLTLWSSLSQVQCVEDLDGAQWVAVCRAIGVRLWNSNC